MPEYTGRTGGIVTYNNVGSTLLEYEIIVPTINVGRYLISNLIVFTLLRSNLHKLTIMVHIIDNPNS